MSEALACFRTATTDNTNNTSVKKTSTIVAISDIKQIVSECLCDTLSRSCWIAIISRIIHIERGLTLYG